MEDTREIEKERRKKRKRGKFDFSKVREYKFYSFAEAIVVPVFKIFLRWRVEGIENIPRDGGAIIASNHVSYIDPVMIALSSRRHVHYMAKAELFKIPVLSWLITHLNAFPVIRGIGDTSAIDYSIKLIDKGDILGIFPEGTRSKTGRPGKAKAGTILIAAKTGAKVIPCAICLPKKRLHIFGKVCVKFGTPIDSSEIAIDEENRNGSIKNACNLLMTRITELLDKDKLENN